MSWHLDGRRREGGGSGLLRPRRSGPRSAMPGTGHKQRQWRLGTKWESRVLVSARSAALVCSLVRGLQLRKQGSSLVATIGMHSWGSRGRRFKSGRPDWWLSFFEYISTLPEPAKEASPFETALLEARADHVSRRSTRTFAKPPEPAKPASQGVKHR